MGYFTERANAIIKQMAENGESQDPSSPQTVRIFSKILNEVIFLTDSTWDVDVLLRKGTKETIYTKEEVRAMEDFTPDQIRAVQLTKKGFPDAIVLTSSGGDTQEPANPSACENPRICKYCGELIIFGQTTDKKWRPLRADGMGFHKCGVARKFKDNEGGETNEQR